MFLFCPIYTTLAYSSDTSLRRQWRSGVLSISETGVQALPFAWVEFEMAWKAFERCQQFTWPFTVVRNGHIVAHCSVRRRVVSAWMVDGFNCRFAISKNSLGSWRKGKKIRDYCCTYYHFILIFDGLRGKVYWKFLRRTLETSIYWALGLS